MSESLNLSSRDNEALQEFAKKIRATLGSRLVSIKLFGSKATRSDVPYSDIDICVIVEDASVEDEDKVLDIAFYINLALDVYISPRVINHAVLDDPVWMITPFIQAIVKEGIPL